MEEPWCTFPSPCHLPTHPPQSPPKPHTSSPINIAPLMHTPYTLSDLHCTPRTFPNPHSTSGHPLCTLCTLTHKVPRPIPFCHVLLLTCMASLAHSVNLANLCHPPMHSFWTSGTSCTHPQLPCIFPDPLHPPFGWTWASPLSLTLQTPHRKNKWRSWQYCQGGRDGDNDRKEGKEGRKISDAQ